jgi:hypothetical protein
MTRQVTLTKGLNTLMLSLSFSLPGAAEDAGGVV